MTYKNFLILTLTVLLPHAFLSAQNVEAPQPVKPLPLEKQLNWQRMEKVAFIHYGLNTFNDKEWGYGDISPETFNPSRQDCEQWVRTIKQAGFKEIVITAKHHDGFCLWPTKENTDYNISCTPYKNGKGDVVGELEKACRKYGLKFGVYLSPWDRHSAVYGTQDYIKYYHAQLKELLTNYGEISEMWFDGANGGDGYYGGSREKRNIDNRHYYNFPYINKYVQEMQPNVIIFSDGGPGCHWIGNEKGISGATKWSFLRINEVYPGYADYGTLTTGHADGDTWVPGEADVSIRPGWFYHDSENSKVRTVDNLVELYYNSVGHNAVLMLNFPPNKEGLIGRTDSINAIEAHKQIRRELAVNILKDATVTASDVRGDAFKAANVGDGSYDTYWSVGDGVKRATLTFALRKKTKVNRVMLQEYVPLGQRVCEFTIRYRTSAGSMDTVSAHEATTTIGYKRIVRFETVTTDRIEIEFRSERGPVCINTAEGFFSGNDDAFSSQHSATAADNSSLDMTAKVKGRDITVDLHKAQKVSRLMYTPHNDGGMIYKYSLYTARKNKQGKLVRGERIAHGEFSNIKNNPVEQTISFNSVTTRFLILHSEEMADTAPTVRMVRMRAK